VEYLGGAVRVCPRGFFLLWELMPFTWVLLEVGVTKLSFIL